MQSGANEVLLDALQQLKSEMVGHFDARMDTLQSDLATIKLSLSNLGEHISELEQRVSSNEDNISDHGKQIKALEKENAYLRDKLDDIENRSRAYNLRFVHVPEKSEGKDTRGFISSLIVHLFGSENFPTPPAIEKAHRSPAQPKAKAHGSEAQQAKAKARRSEAHQAKERANRPSMHQAQNNAKPRVIMVRFLSLLDRDKVLQLAREKQQLVYNGEQIHIFPDFSAAVVNKRREFDDIKKQLQERKMEYHMLFPATLVVNISGKSVQFKTPDEVLPFLQETGNVD